MNDFDYLSQIEKELGIKLIKLNKLDKKQIEGDGANTYYYRIERVRIISYTQHIGYVLDENNCVTGIYFYNCDIKTIQRIIEPLTCLSNLLELDISNNHINDLAPLSELKGLTTLIISDNQITDLGPLTKLTRLSFLNVLNNQVYDLDPLSDLICLSSLIVSNNQITDLSPIAKLTRLSFLNIENNKITDILPLINIKRLVFLNFSFNRVFDLTPLSKHTDLSTLIISDNQITDLGALEQLTHLSFLNVSNNQIHNLKPLAQLINLVKLIVSHNNINDLKPLSKLTNLTLLNLLSNQVIDLDPLANLINLTTLSISDNQIIDLAPLAELPLLIFLAAWGNQITDIAPIAHLTNLSTLHLSKNPIKTLPQWITNFKMDIEWEDIRNNNCITFFDNPLETPPPEIVKLGTKAVRNYFIQLEEQGRDYLFEAKLLIVGEAGAGKTSLARKLENRYSPLPNDKDTTRGIDVKPIFSPLRPEDFPNLEARKLDEKKFRMNVWDFGGQEIYKATHRFFLSNRSLYVLVVDNRREDVDFNYWLHVIEMFSGNSPILIVSNEKQQRKRDIDVDALRQRFTNIKEIYDVDFAEPDNRFDKLKIAIQYQIKGLPHTGISVPSRWTSVRNALEKKRKKTISLQEYLILCKKSNISKREDALVMSQYFHDIGVFLHFQGDTQLNKTVFLNPNWVHKRFTSCSTIRCLTSNMADSAVKMPLLSGTKRSMQIFAMSCSAYWESFSSHTKLMGQVDTLCRKSCLRQALHILGIRLEISTCNIPTTSLCREESYRSS